MIGYDDHTTRIRADKPLTPYDLDLRDRLTAIRAGDDPDKKQPGKCSRWIEVYKRLERPLQNGKA